MSSGIHPSVPPPRKPGLASCSPERYSLGVAIATWFRAWCRDHNISQRDLCAILDCSLAIAQAKLEGRSPVTLVDVAKFPDRYQADLSIGFLNVARAHRASFATASEVISAHA